MKANDRIKLVLGAMLVMGLIAIASTHIPTVRAAVNWSLSRVGSTVSIDDTGAISLAPKSGKAVAVTRNLNVTGDVAVNTNKFNVTASSGNTAVGGTLGVTGLLTASAGATVPTGQTVTITDADALTVGGVKVPQVIEIGYRCGAAATCVSSSFFISGAAYQVTAVNVVWGTAESTASNLRVQVEKLTGTTAAGSGTALLTNNSNAGVSIKATANTVTAGTLTGTTGSLQLAAGDRLGIKFETTPTEGASVVVTVTLKRI